jgi:hypothetical protein
MLERGIELELRPAKPGFRGWTGGVYVPEIEVPGGPFARDELAARDKELGRYAVDDRPDFLLA